MKIGNGPQPRSGARQRSKASQWRTRKQWLKAKGKVRERAKAYSRADQVFKLSPNPPAGCPATQGGSCLALACAGLRLPTPRPTRRHRRPLRMCLFYFFVETHEFHSCCMCASFPLPFHYLIVHPCDSMSCCFWVPGRRRGMSPFHLDIIQPADAPDRLMLAWNKPHGNPKA